MGRKRVLEGRSEWSECSHPARAPLQPLHWFRGLFAGSLLWLFSSNEIVPNVGFKAEKIDATLSEGK